MTDDAPPPEALREGRYRGLRVLGEGAQGTTYEATDVAAGRLVAVKRFVVKGARSWKQVELAEREAKVIASVDHPLLPRYVEHFEEGGELFLVTEKIEGESLAAIRARGGRLDEAEVARLLADLAEALAYLHGRSPPIIHRDVKPGNVIRRADGRFSLVDFGSVRDRLRPEGGSTVVGTFGYMAPEQFQGRAMAQSDVYGAAATAMTMLTGAEPEALPHRGLAIDVRSALGRRAPEALIHALERMLDPDPDRRAPRVAIPLGIPSNDAGKRSARGADEADERRRRRARRQQRDEERSREHDLRRRGNRDQRERWQRRVRVAGGLSRVAASLGLLVAIIAVQVACRVVVPTVLVTLSLLFGAPLREAARKVAAAGVDATRALDRARVMAMGLRLPDEEDDLEAEADRRAERGDSVRVAPHGAAPRPPPATAKEVDATAEAEAEALAEEESNAQARGRRR